jgi:hypothetical protein
MKAIFSLRVHYLQLLSFLLIHSEIVKKYQLLMSDLNVYVLRYSCGCIAVVVIGHVSFVTINLC